MGLILGVLLALVPLLITPNLHLFFDVTPKVALILAGAAVALAVSGGAVPLDRAGRLRPAPKAGQEAGAPAGTPGPPGAGTTCYRFRLLLLAAFVWLCVATAASPDRYLSVWGTNWRRAGLPVLAALLALAFSASTWLAVRRDGELPLLRVMSLAGLAASVYGILQYFGWDPLLFRPGYLAGEGEWTIVRPPSTLGHAGYFATWLLFPVFSSVGVALGGKSRVWRAVAAASVVAGSAAIVLSGTRAALLALIAGGVILARWMRVGLSRKAAWTGVAAAVLVVGFYISPAGGMLRSRVHWIGEDIHGGARLWLWADTLRMAATRPVAGFGPETFSKFFPRFESAALAQAYPEYYHESPHNLFLEASAATGLPGLAILIALTAIVIAAGSSAGRKDPLAKTLTVAFGASLLSLQFTPAVPAIGLYGAVVAAMLVSRDAAPAGGRPPWPAAAVAALAAVVFAGLAARLWVADTMLHQAGLAIDRGNALLAARKFQDAASWGANADLWFSRRMLQLEQTARDPAVRLAAWRAALGAAERAPEQSENPQNALYNRAAFCAIENNAACTESNLRAAIAAAPRWYKAHWMLARLFETTGRLAEAEPEARLAVDLNAGKDAEVTRTLESIRAARGARK